MAHAFLYMNMIEKWGSGISKLMREMKEYGLREPEFVDMEIGFCVNLYRKQDVSTNQDTSQEPYIISQEIDKTSQETNKIIQKTIDADQETEHKEILGLVLSNTDKILNAIAKSPSVTQKELQGLTGLSRSGVRYILQQMRAAGKLERTGSTKKGKWILKE